MKEQRPRNGTLKLWHALLYTVAALANFCVLEMVWVFVAMLILGAYSDQNPWAIFWRISLIYDLDQYYNLQQTVVAFIVHVWYRCNKSIWRKNTVEARMNVWGHTKSTMEDFVSSYCTIIHES